MSAAPGEAVAAPIACTSGFFFGANTTQVFERASDGTITAISTAPTSVNSVAWSAVDGNMYAFSSTAGVLNHLFRIDDGGATDLGEVTGLPASNVYVASFDDAGVLRVASGIGTTLYGIDVSSLTATSLPLSNSISGDLAELNGGMYAIRSGALARIDFATGTVTLSSPTPGLNFPSGSALWAADGHLYVSTATGIGEIVNYATTTPTVQPVATGVTPAPSDGASCPSAGNPFLNAENDDFTNASVFAGVGGVAGDVFDNDTLNGATFSSTDVAAAIMNDGGLAGVTVAADGTLTVPATAQPGTYTVGYRICQTAATRTGVCDTATATIRVQGLPVVNAVDDGFTTTPITAGSGGTAGNVFADDTIDGVAVTAANVTATIEDGDGLTGITLTGSGDLFVPSSATPGTYAVTYEICATAAPTACDTATALLSVIAVQTPANPPSTSEPGSGDASTPRGTGSGAAAGDTDRLAATGTNLSVAVPAMTTATFALLGGALLLLGRRRRKVVAELDRGDATAADRR